MEEQIIVSKQRVKDFGEVFTPTHIVKQMCDLVQEQCYEDNCSFFEPTCGTGNFLVEILSRKLNNIACDRDEDDITHLRILVALGSLYGCDIQEDNVSICKERLRDMVCVFAKGIGVALNVTLVNIILDTNIRVANTLTDTVVFCKVEADDMDNKIMLTFSSVDFNKGSSSVFLRTEHPV